MVKNCVLFVYCTFLSVMNSISAQSIRPSEYRIYKTNSEEFTPVQQTFHLNPIGISGKTTVLRISGLSTYNLSFDVSLAGTKISIPNQFCSELKGNLIHPDSQITVKGRGELYFNSLNLILHIKLPNKQRVLLKLYSYQSLRESFTGQVNGLGRNGKFYNYAFFLGSKKIKEIGQSISPEFKNGEWLLYHNCKHPVYRMNYKDNIQHGDAVEYRCDMYGMSHIREKGSYSNGIRIGKWSVSQRKNFCIFIKSHINLYSDSGTLYEQRFYYKSGLIKAMYFYENTKLIRLKTFSRTGKIIFDGIPKPDSVYLEIHH